MNLLHIIGFLGADPEERFTPSGQKLWVLRVATRSKKGGQEETIWWRITVWGDHFDKMLSYFKKGKPIYIIAEMNKLDIYTDKNGQPQISYEATARSLHFLPYSNERQDQEGQQQNQQRGYQGGSSTPQQPQANAAANYGGANHSGQQSDPMDFSAAMAPVSGAGSEVEEFAGEDEPVPF